MAAEMAGAVAADQESAIINFSYNQVTDMVSKDIGGDDAMNFIADLGLYVGPKSQGELKV